MFVVTYLQYGKWYVTMPFDDASKARMHASRHLLNNEIRDKEGKLLTADTNGHITDVYVVPFDPRNGEKLK